MTCLRSLKNQNEVHERAGFPNGARWPPVAMVSDMCPYRWELDFFKLNQTWGHYQPFSKQCLLVAASYNLVVPNPPPPTVFPTMLTFQNLTNLFHFFFFQQWRNQWFNAWGSLHIWSKVLEGHTSICCEWRAGHGASLGPWGRGKAEITSYREIYIR